MTEQFLRIGGTDGTHAKGIRTNEEGFLKTEVIQKPILLAQNLVVPGDTTVNVVSEMEINDCSSITIGVRADSGAPTISIEIIPVVAGLFSGINTKKVMDKQALNGNSGVSEKYELIAPNLRIRLTNHSNATRTFNVYINKFNVPFNDSKMEYYGKAIDDRPSIYTVPIGALYMAVDSQEVWQSNGESWVKIQ